MKKITGSMIIVSMLVFWGLAISSATYLILLLSRARKLFVFN